MQTARAEPVHWDRREGVRTLGDAESAEHVLRWRHGEKDERQSNARVVEWSDGTMTLHIGQEAIFEVVQVAPAPAPRPPCACLLLSCCREQRRAFECG